MSRLVLVRVAVGDPARRFTASFALDASNGGRVERAGTLRGTPEATDPLLGAFRGACEVARRPAPESLRVRASSELGAGAGTAAAAVAGAAGARALLDLPLSDAELVAIAARASGTHDGAAECFARHDVSLHQICEDAEVGRLEVGA